MACLTAMGLRVVGAGLGRTGTNSLKLALERILGEPCYHMLECFPRPEHVDLWASAYAGTIPDWEQLYVGFGATVDWPAGPFWAQISEAFPDALILLSVRDPDAWWKSASSTIFRGMARSIDEDPDSPWTQMASRMVTSFSRDWRDEAAAKAAFLAHNDHVRRTAPADRLLEWQASDGWSPICERLGLPVPDAPFPHVNTTDHFRAMFSLTE